MEVLDILTFTFLILLAVEHHNFSNWIEHLYLEKSLKFLTQKRLPRHILVSYKSYFLYWSYPQNLNKQSVCVSFFQGKNWSNFLKFKLPLKILNKQSVCWNFLQRRIEKTICIKVLSLTWWVFKEILSSYLPEALPSWSFIFLKLYHSEALSSSLSSWSFIFLKPYLLVYLPKALSFWIFLEAL
jgi:hypothetical protein